MYLQNLQEKYNTFTQQDIKHRILNFFLKIVENTNWAGAVLVVIVCSLDLQLPMQLLPITTKVVNSNPAQVRCTRYNIM